MKVGCYIGPLAMLFYVACSPAIGGPIAVAGVAVVKGTTNRAPVSNVTFHLMGDKIQGGRYTMDRTSREGVFNLSCGSVDDTVTGLWVKCVDPKYHARPCEAPLDSPVDGVRRASLPDIEVEHIKQKYATVKQVAWHMVAVQETVAVDMNLKILDRKMAKAMVLNQAAAILTQAPQIARDPKQITATVKEMNAILNKKLLPEPFLNEDNMSILKLMPLKPNGVPEK